MTPNQHAEKIVSRIEQWLLVRSAALEGGASADDLVRMRERIAEAISAALNERKE